MARTWLPGCLLAAAAAAACGATEVSVGLIGGARAPGAPGLSLDRPNIGSATGALFADIHSGNFKLRPEIGTFRRHYAFDEPNDLGNGRVDIHHHEWSLQYTELPLMMSWLFYDGAVQPAAILGVRPTFPGWGVDGQIACDRIVERDYYPFNSFWVGFSAGLGLDIPLGAGVLVTEARWDVDYPATRKDAEFWRAGAWRFQAGWGFGGGRRDADEADAKDDATRARRAGRGLKALRKPLKQLKQMRDEGLISREEYEQRRARLLGVPEPPPPSRGGDTDWDE